MTRTATESTAWGCTVALVLFVVTYATIVGLTVVVLNHFDASRLVWIFAISMAVGASGVVYIWLGDLMQKARIRRWCTDQNWHVTKIMTFKNHFGVYYRDTLGEDHYGRWGIDIGPQKP